MTTDPTPDPTETLAAWRAVTEGATEGATLTRYDHGGGRLAVTTDADRTLVADFYNEGDREFYTLARDAMPRLLAFAEAVLALHVPDDHGPGRCDASGCETACVLDGEDWPCQTVRLAEHLGGEGQ